MSIADDGRKGKSADLEIPKALAGLGVPVWHTKLNRAGGPVREGWQNIPASASAREIAEYHRGDAMCATAGVVFDVIDRDPKNDPESHNWTRLLNLLGEDGPEYFLHVRTPSGGQHYYIPTLGLGRKYNPIPGFSGVDLQAEKSLVFLPPTHRKGGGYEVIENNLDEYRPVVCRSLKSLILRAAAKPVSEGAREEVSSLRRAVIDAEAGEQRMALLRLVHEYERKGYDREDIILLLLQLNIQNFDERRPWRSADFRSLLHAPGRVLPDAAPGELDGIGEPVRSSEESKAQRLENIRALMRMKALSYARDALEAETALPALEIHSLDLETDMAMPRPMIAYAVDEIATAGAQVTLPSSRKTGKTTFLLNLCRAAGNGVPFLDRFECSLDGNIGYLNAEMLRADILGYCDHLGDGVWTSRVHMLHCREDGLRLNLLSDSVCESVVRWCGLYDIEWLVLDPWKNFLTWSGVGMNDNDGVLALSERCRSLSVAARLQLMMIPLHTTQAGPENEGGERGKGAGELEDGADWLWRYTRVGGAADPRVFSVEGRGPGVD
jgi:hypothetical protein